MQWIEQLREYFTDGIQKGPQTVGAEVETQFVDAGGAGNPVSEQRSQQILMCLSSRGWTISDQEGEFITDLVDEKGNRISYELGRHNIEVATIPATPNRLPSIVQECLDRLYEVAEMFGAVPHFAPILPGEEDLLVVPDERDAIWVKLDGREALAPLARTSSFQLTVSVASPDDAVRILNILGNRITVFLENYPQDEVWEEYIHNSFAGYRPDRYGGPIIFDSLDDYCRKLAQHDAVQGACLVPLMSVSKLDIPLFLRSVWWYFRLKRFGDILCIEVRPMARGEDKEILQHLQMVMDMFESE